MLGSIVCKLSLMAKSSTEMIMELVTANKLAVTPRWCVNLELKKNILIYSLGICGALRKNLDIS